MLAEFLTKLMQPMALFGLIGQAVFFSRFLIQWIASERKGESVIPEIFWYLSLVGSMMVLVYAIWIRDPVFTMAQMFGTIVYSRNLVLIRRKKKVELEG